ncbi:MAG: alpha-isopropylmalate synthase regulatory domain-containing protein, partial [Pyrinomonadaceae bacterium]
NALDQALRRALEKFYPALAEVRLVDYKVRVRRGSLSGTASLVRVLITSGDSAAQWGTVGVSSNIVEASWRALVDAVEYKLLKDGAEPPPAETSVFEVEERITEEGFTTETQRHGL